MMNARNPSLCLNQDFTDLFDWPDLAYRYVKRLRFTCLFYRLRRFVISSAGLEHNAAKSSKFAAQHKLIFSSDRFKICQPVSLC